MKTSRPIGLLLFALALAGCSSMLVKSANDADDSKAKQLDADPNYALVYVYRDNSFMGSELKSELFVNKKMIANGASNRFNVLSLPPGHYDVSTASIDSGALPALLHNRDKPALELTVVSGELYFVHETFKALKGFLLSAATREEAEPAIKKGKLIAVHRL
jgi:Protein of unknown function (DUF2846)